MSAGASCKDCRHCVPQFGEFTGQRTWFACRLSGVHTDQERNTGKCGPAGAFFSAFVPLDGDVESGVKRP